MAINEESAKAQEVELTKEQEVLKDIIRERQEIAEKINGKKVSDAILTVVQRAEMFSKVHGKDFYITTVENGIAFFPEEEYEKLTSKTITDLRSYLTEKGITGPEQETEVDNYAANLVIHYIDFKSFSDDEVQEARKRFGVAPKNEEEISEGK